MDQVKQDVTVKQGYQKPDRRIEFNQVVTVEDDEHFTPLNREMEYSRSDFPYDVFQQESGYIEESERNEQFVYFADKKTSKPFIGFKEDAGYKKIKRHAKAGYH